MNCWIKTHHQCHRSLLSGDGEFLGNECYAIVDFDKDREFKDYQEVRVKMQGGSFVGKFTLSVVMVVKNDGIYKKEMRCNNRKISARSAVKIGGKNQEWLQSYSETLGFSNFQEFAEFLTLKGLLDKKITILTLSWLDQ